MQILFRVDASESMGSGHVMRCLALAEAFHDLGHSCHFLAQTMLPALEARLASEGVSLRRLEKDPGAERTCWHAWDLDAAVILVDGYHFSESWRANLHRFARTARRLVLAFEDFPLLQAPHADFLLNVAADAETPAPPNGPIHLYGTEFLLLRREIRQAARRIPKIEDRPGILVTFGGTDPAGLTLPVARALLAELGPRAPLDIVIGAGFRDPAAISAALAALGSGIRLRRDPRDMGRLMALSGLAISAGGGTVGELAALQVPAVLVIVADNQSEGTRRASADGWCQALDSRTEAGSPAAIAGLAADLWHDQALRGRMADRARGRIPLDGAERVARRLLAAVAN